jgi:hypothetical protein
MKHDDRILLIGESHGLEDLARAKRKARRAVRRLLSERLQTRDGLLGWDAAAICEARELIVQTVAAEQ